MAIFPGLRGKQRSIRRIGVIGGILTVVLGLGAYHLLSGGRVKPIAVTASKLPDADATPGGEHATPYIRKVTTEAIRRKARRAEQEHVSATADLPPANPATPVSEQVSLPPPVNPEPQTTPTRYPPAPPAPPSTPSVNMARYDAYTAALKKISLGGPSYVTHVYVKDVSPTPVVKAFDPPSTIRSGGTAVPHAVSVVPAATVLIPADHGIYGRTLTGVSSDQSDATVVVQAESGPIAGDRMSGGFSTEGDRLVVKLTELSLRDGQQVPIDAVLVAPDSMDEAVATGVDHHYATRFILPIAAAFVEGLGQAVETANSVVQESALGGITAYNHLNLGQELGVAAGTAGQTAGQLIQEAAPHGPTVTLASYADVGVLFLKPVKVPAGEH
ncbi:MAG: TrbI/VirB10 family protein [Acidiphilium sp.]|nr:TrbI/VirB10 family protein [Acidiphilium sp.]MDD4937058.1 TrbI/VirB10 family protein [Acidiphilium sp.]